jgi:hypothetical protein
MSVVYNFSLEIFKDAPRNMNSSELAEFIQKAYDKHKEDYKNEYLQSLDAIIYLYTGIYLYEILNTTTSNDDKQAHIHNDQKADSKQNSEASQNNAEHPLDDGETLEPVKTGLVTDEDYEKLLGYE